jgi:putative ABC transport system permease protein
MALVIRQSLALVFIGIVLGMVGAYLLVHVVEKMLSATAPTDTLTFAAVPLILLGVALVATLLPARRATRVDPIEALRCE